MTETVTQWPALCQDCKAQLTLEEHHYYETRCERCEGNWFSRIEAWRAGGEDDELEEQFS